MLRWLILGAELIVAIDATILAALIVMHHLARDDFAEFSEIRDWALWSAEMNSWTGAQR
jgi:hypothetical protein